VRRASNALSMLNLGKISFSNMDLSNITIKGSLLMEAAFHYTNLQNSTLEDVDIKTMYMKESLLKNTKITEKVNVSHSMINIDRDSGN